MKAVLGYDHNHIDRNEPIAPDETEKSSVLGAGFSKDQFALEEGRRASEFFSFVGI